MHDQPQDAIAVEFTKVCHDLRQYVSAGLLLTQMPGDEAFEAAARPRLDNIRQIFRRMAELISTQMSLTEPREWLVDLVELVDECVQVVRLTHEAAVVTDFDDKALVFGDPVLLRRAVTNVLDNAGRAAGRDGSVTVRVVAEDEQSCVEVADDGVGFGLIPSGTGHGLSTVDSALRACQGRLEIASGPGPGTTVRLMIPNQRGEVAS
jgi:signal transduction histidine kinase